MLRLTTLCLAIIVAAGACRSATSNERTYTLRGQVLGVERDQQKAMIKHDEIKGLMPAMTMMYTMKDGKILDGVKAGDLISATLVIASDNAYITQVTKTGEAPLEQPPEAPATARSGLEPLKPGEAVPDAHFVDQNGKRRDFSAFKGSIVAITFIYTKCPLPTFCPLMDRHFATVQKAITSDAALKKVHLVSVSFDPLTDTPAVLLRHARELKADPARWTFLTGNRDDIDQFGARFGVLVTRAPNDQLDIAHNLRTAIVDPDGKLVKVYTGNGWTPTQLLADVRSIAGAN